MILTDVLEVNVVHHCNNRCASCNHASPFSEPYTMNPVTLREDLEALKPMLHTGFFCLQGGEPLLHPDILLLMDISRNSGIADKYGMLTNGRLLDRMPEEFWRTAGEMKLELRHSVYPNLPPEIVPYATEKAKQFGVDYRPVNIGVFVKVLGDFPKGESFYRCPWRKCHTLHEGRFYICPLAVFFPKQFMDLPEGTDGWPLKSPEGEIGLRAYINCDVPLSTCRICTGAQGEGIEWHQCDDREQWLKDSTQQLK